MSFPPLTQALELQASLYAQSTKIHETVEAVTLAERKEAHLVQYDAGEWHQLESLLDEARTHWKMLTFQASYDRKLHHKVSEYRNLWDTFSEALTLLRKGRHV